MFYTNVCSPVKGTGVTARRSDTGPHGPGDRRPAGRCRAEHGSVRAPALRDRPLLREEVPDPEPARLDRPGRDGLDRAQWGFLLLEATWIVVLTHAMIVRQPTRH